MAHQFSLWCAHPRLQRHEALSAWLHRVAFANGLSNHSFTYRTVSATRWWARDIERCIDGPALSRLAEAIGEPISALEAATLRSFTGRIFASVSMNGWMPWVTPVGIYHSLRRHHGWSFCPSCLAEASLVRLTGRLAYEVACPRHRTALLDGCPRCDAPFAFHRVSVAQPGRFPCPTCGFNLARSLPRPVPEHAWRLQQRLHRCLAQGYAVLPNQTVSVLDFFNGLRVLVRGIHRKTHWAGLHDGLPSQLRRRLGDTEPAGLFENRRLRARSEDLTILSFVLNDWPNQFLNTCRHGHVQACRFEGWSSIATPTWIVDVLARLRAQ